MKHTESGYIKEGKASHSVSQNEIGIAVEDVVISHSAKRWHELATNGEWINARMSPPTESGRYWCVVREQGDLGLARFQWNCSYHVSEKRWSDNMIRQDVTHYVPLMAMPHLL